MRLRFLKWRSRRAWKRAGKAIDRANRYMDQVWDVAFEGATFRPWSKGHRDWLPTMIEKAEGP